MKILVCYYSATGNTQLVCEYLAHRLSDHQVELVNVIDSPDVDLTAYDAVGFATATNFMGLPFLFADFMAQLPAQQDKPAFVLNTYGAMSGRTLKLLAHAATERGFTVIAGHSLLVPENYPPFILKGWANEAAPDEKELAGLNQFIADLTHKLHLIRSGQTPQPAKIKIGLFNHLLAPGSLAKAKKEIGVLMTDERLCTACATCADVCPYNAIAFDEKPVFNAAQCHGCWRCFNHCPEKAIYTSKIKGEGHYPQPHPTLVAKFTR